jgi:hypothetical protein
VVRRDEGWVVGREVCTAGAVAQDVWCAGKMAHAVLICLRLLMGQQLEPLKRMAGHSTKRVLLSFLGDLLGRVPASPVRENEAED